MHFKPDKEKLWNYYYNNNNDGVIGRATEHILKVLIVNKPASFTHGSCETVPANDIWKKIYQELGLISITNSEVNLKSLLYQIYKHYYVILKGVR